MADIALEMEDQREIAETLEDISTARDFGTNPEFKDGSKMMRKLIFKKIVLCCIVINSFLIINAQEKN